MRAAISWLVKRGAVERVGTTQRLILPAKRYNRDSYPVLLYQLKEEAAPVDFAALMGALCRA